MHVNMGRKSAGEHSHSHDALLDIYMYMLASRKKATTVLTT